MGSLGQNFLFFKVHLLCSLKKKQTRTEPLLCGTVMCNVLPWPQAFSDEHDRISHKYNRAVMRRTLPSSTSFHSCASTSISSLWSKRTLKSATLWQYNYDTNAEAATVCIPNMYETASLQKAGLRQCSVTCLWNRMLSLRGDYDGQNN